MFRYAITFQHSAEGDVSGLELVPGNIVPIQSSHPIPHLGWNELKEYTSLTAK